MANTTYTAKGAGSSVNAQNNNMSAEDQKSLYDIGVSYGKATTQAEKDALHQQAESIRAKYGYSGGTDGSENISTLTDSEKILQAQINQLKSDNNSYAQALKAQQAANNAATKQAVNSLNTQIGETEQSYADLYRQLYLDKMKSQKNIDQRMAASGINGGAAESTLLGLDTSYADALRSGEVSKIAAINQLQKAISDAELTGDISNAEAASEYALKQQEAYKSALGDLYNYYSSKETTAAENARTDAENTKAYAYKQASTMLSSGIMPSDAVLSAAGISKVDAQAIVDQYAAQQKTKTVSGTTAASYSKTAADIALSSYLAGNQSADNVAVIEGYYKMPIDDVVSWYKANNQTSISDDEFNIAMNRFLAGDTSDNILQIVQARHPNMTLDQIKAAYTQEETSYDYNTARSAVEQVYKNRGQESALTYIGELLKEGAITSEIWGDLYAEYKSKK